MHTQKKLRWQMEEAERKRPKSRHELALNEYIKQAKENGQGFLAYTVVQDMHGKLVKGRGFNPMYPDWGTTPKGHLKTFLMRKGVHQDIELHMLTRPGGRVPSKEFNEKYKKYGGVTKGGVQNIARKITEHHKLPARKAGGPNFRFEKMHEAMGQFYEKARPRSEVPVRKLMVQIAKESGRLPWPTAINAVIQKLESENPRKKNLKMNYAGISTEHDMEEIVQELGKQGIKVEIKRRRIGGG